MRKVALTIVAGLVLVQSAALFAQPVEERILLPGRAEAGGPIDLYAVYPDGSGLINLTSDFDWDARYVAVSPDAGRIAFLAYVDGVTELWLADADGGSPVQLNASTPLFNPISWYGSEHVVYTSEISTCSKEVRIINVDTGDDTLLVPSGFFPNESLLREAAVSPDQQYLLFHAERGCSTPRGDLYAVRMADALADPMTAEVACFYVDADDYNEDRYPVWSPDGSMVYWTHNWDSGLTEPRGIVAKAFSWPPTDCNQYDSVVRGPDDIFERLYVCAASPAGDTLLFSDAASYIHTLDIATAETMPFVDPITIGGQGSAYWGNLQVVDCDGNGVLDREDLVTNPDADMNGNGIIDSCEGPTLVMRAPAAPDDLFVGPSDITSVTLLFSEPMTLTAADVSVLNRDGIAVDFNVSGDGTAMITVNFDAPLYGNAYTVTVSDAAYAVGSGNALDGDGDGYAGGDLQFTLTQHGPIGDIDGDGAVNNFDIDPFVQILTGG